MKGINIGNVMSFLEGNLKQLKYRFKEMPDYVQEQVSYRLDLCKESCVKKGACQYCGCPPVGKSFVKKSCNNGEIFPDLMGEAEWEAFKAELEAKKNEQVDD